MTAPDREVPSEITTAVRLLWGVFWVSVAQSVLGYAIAFWPLNQRSELLLVALAGAVGVVIGAAFTDFFLRRVVAGRNWARIILVLGFLFNLFGLVADAEAWIANPLQPSVLSIVATGLYGYAVFLLFAAPGRNWFAAKGA